MSDTPRSSRIEPIVDLAEMDAREAARLLASTSRELTRGEEELARLKVYLDEYRQRGGNTAPALSTERWRNDRLFIARLQEVIDARETTLATVRARHSDQLESWRRSHRYNRALQQLFERYCEAELADRERLEQDETDELVLRALRSD